MKDKLLLITLYPPKATIHGSNVGGVASYAKNTVLATQEKIEYTVLAQRIEHSEEEYIEDGNRIMRCWRRGSILYLYDIVSKLISCRSYTNRLMVEFEYAIFGNEFITGFFPIILLAGRLLGYRITLVQHQVVIDFDELSPHLSLSGSKKNTYTFLMQTYTRLLLKLASTIVVFDEIHKERIAKLLPNSEKKVKVIPHGVEKCKDTNTSATSWYEMNIGNKAGHDILMFGFIAQYKGSLTAVSQFLKFISNNPGSKTRLIVAGGESPSQKDTESYKTFYSKFKEKVNEGQSIIHTGFVPEQEIDNVYKQSDIVILPYEALMSSSGPLSLAIKNKVPFLISDKISRYTHTHDYKDAIEMSFENINNYPILDLARENIFETVTAILEDEACMEKLCRVSEYLYEHRQWDNLGKKYVELLTKTL